MAWMQTNTTTPAPTCTPAWSTLGTMAPVETITSPDDASRGNGRHGSTQHEYTLSTGASGETRRNNGGMGGENGHQTSPRWDYCCYVVCTSMGTGVGEERQGGSRLLRGSEIPLGRWRIMGAGGNFRWMYFVYSLFQLHPVDFRVGYRVCPTILCHSNHPARSIS